MGKRVEEILYKYGISQGGVQQLKKKYGGRRI